MIIDNKKSLLSSDVYWSLETRKKMGFGNKHTKITGAIPLNWQKRFLDYQKNFINYTFDQFKQLCEDCRKEFPNCHYTLEPIVEMLIYISKSISSFEIIEIGGAEGYLANDIFIENSNLPIKKWHNLEISDTAREHSICKDIRYKPLPLLDYLWKEELDLDQFKNYNILIATHVLEHFTEDYLNIFFRNLEKVQIPYYIIEMPLKETTQDQVWDDTHLLKIGWKEVILLLKKYHYEEIPLGYKMVHCFKYTNN